MQIVLIGGFACTKKKTALFSAGNELVARGNKVAIINIEDAAGNEGVSTDPNSAIMIIEKKDIPCTFITDLMVELPKINGLANSDYLLVEVPFSLAPGKVKEYLSDLDFKDLVFAPIIYLFDAKMNPENDAKMIPKIVSKQITESEIIFTQVDATDHEKISALNRTFEELNPDATIFRFEADSDGHRISDLVDMIIN